MSTDDGYLKQLLDFIASNAERQDKRMDSLESKIDANTVLTNKVFGETRHTNGRVTELEHRSDKVDGVLKSLRKAQGKKIKIPEVSTQAISFLAFGFVVLLAIIAHTLHINIGNLLE